MHKVIHLLPYDGIGGAEAAARSMRDQPPHDFDFKLDFIFPSSASAGRRLVTFNPIALLASVRRIAAQRPDLLIVSLWRACIVGVLVKLLARRTRLVVMIHNSVDAHLADKVSTRLAMALADGVWADSESSVRLRFRTPPRCQVSVIPFLTHHLVPPVDRSGPPSPTPDFVFWGRLAPQKNLGRALAIFRDVHLRYPQARYLVIGPDSGSRAALRMWCEKAGIANAVDFAGPMDEAGIREASGRNCFYLQTSSYEGMAMAVVEAMQLGLVPVVTPVGEIGRYCRTGVNAVVVEDDNKAVDAIAALLEDPAAWRLLRQGALQTWQGRPIYRDAMADACRQLLPVDAR